MPDVQLPYNYDPRSYQEEVWNALIEITQDDAGQIQVRLLKDRAFLKWHRRAGKDLTIVNLVMVLAYYHRVGTYWYLFPFRTQAKETIWDGKDDSGRRFVDYFPSEIVYDTNETELQITLCDRAALEQGVRAPGSVIQLKGADKFSKSSVGPNPVGVVLSEYAVSVKMQVAWNLIQPMLASNGGFAFFATTPRGKNHAYQLWNSARQSDRWFTSLKTVNDTRRDSSFDKVNPHRRYLDPVVTEEQIQNDMEDGMSEEKVQQEYYCSDNATMQGAYFSKAIDELRRQGKVGIVPWEPGLPVETWWDIGRDDNTSIWFVQKLFREIRLIDFYTNRLKEFTHYVQALKTDDFKDGKTCPRSKYIYDRHVGPHDLEVDEWFVGRTRKETAASLGVHFTVQPKCANKMDSIEFARSILPRCLFNERNTQYGLNALECYHAEADEEDNVLNVGPHHDWSSNPADAFQVGASADSTGHGTGVHGTGTRHRQTTGGSSNYNILASNFQREKEERRREWRNRETETTLSSSR